MPAKPMKTTPAMDRAVRSMFSLSPAKAKEIRESKPGKDKATPAKG